MFEHPRHFVPANDPIVSLSPENTPILNVLDVFSLASGLHAPQETIVAVDSLGQLRLVSTKRSTLSPRMQSQLSFHELVGNSHRIIDAHDLFIFELQLMEQTADTPGINDPVYLYGNLVGPIRPHEELKGPILRGQLTVTRADLLQGLLDGQPHAFQYSKQSEVAPAALAHHLVLPGGNEAETLGGQGLVLAYPLLPLEISHEAGAGQVLVQQMLRDVLDAMKADVASQATGLLANVARLFVKRANSSVSDDADIDEYFDIARHELSRLKGWPDPRAVALKKCVRRSATEPAKDRAPGVTPLRRAPIVPPQPVRTSSEPPIWIQDFIRGHRHSPAGAPPVLTTGVKISLPRTDDWMSDFEEPRSSLKPDKKERGPNDEDWMKDFE